MLMLPEREISNTGSVLIADDDPGTRLLIRRALERVGNPVYEVGDGIMALEAFDAFNPQLVILDVRMPGLDGYATCRRLRQLPNARHTPILMLTGHDDSDSVAGAFDAGATDYFIKPIYPLLLIQRIHNLLHTHATDEALYESRTWLTEVQRIAGFGYWEWWPSAERFSCSDRACEIFDCDPALCGSYEQWLRGVPATCRAALQTVVERAVAGGQGGDCVFKLNSSDGSVRFIQQHLQIRTSGDNGPLRIIGTVQDITSRRETERRIRKLSHYDDTTGLPNRKLIEQRIEQILERHERAHSILAVLCISVDRCKYIYDTFGNSVGDEFLCALSSKLSVDIVRGTTIREAHCRQPTSWEVHMGYLGDGEFVLVFGGLDTQDDVLAIVRKIHDVLAGPIVVHDCEIRVQPRIGVSMHPHDGGQGDVLLNRAITALHYSDSELVSRTCRFYSGSMNEAAMKRLTLESELRQALNQQQFELYFQAKIGVTDGVVRGAEALVRWRHPKRGLIAPADFITVAEETGLIVELGDWVLRQACRQLAHWRSLGLPLLRVAVNLSPVQFNSSDLVDSVRRVLREVDLVASDLELELTESTVMKDVEMSLKTLRALKNMGVFLSIDDFGTGYSSMSYLKQLPINILKIDRSFVSEVATNADNAAIVTAITVMAHKLRLTVVAEGVETMEQFEFLRDLGCDEIQGYLFSRPLSEQDFPEWFVNRVASGLRPDEHHPCRAAASWAVS